MKPTMLLSLLSGLLSGCVMSADYEPVYGVKQVTPGMAFDVRSTGCTKTEDFVIKETGKGLLLVRLKPDTCRRKAYVKQIIMPTPDNARNKPLINPVFLAFR